MADTQDHILIVVSDQKKRAALERMMRAAGFFVTLFEDGDSALRQAQVIGGSLVLLAERLNKSSTVDLLGDFARRHPALPVVVLAEQASSELLLAALHQGASDVVTTAMASDDIVRTVRAVLAQNKRRKDAQLLEARRFTSSLERQVGEMETLTRLGRQITAKLDLDGALAAIVDAAVQLTGAEEGSLLLIDQDSGELYMRAARNFQEDFVRTFRLPITDSLAGRVISEGKAVLFDEGTPQKIKTSYLVQSLLYVPLSLHGTVLGVLGVDNRHSRLPLTQHHVSMLNALSAYAVIALENARLYENMTAERNKLETILTGIQDGVMVVDQDKRLGLVNKAARDAFAMDDDARLMGQPFLDLFHQPELVALADAPDDSLSTRSEISPDNNRVFGVQVTPIAGVGRVFTLNDITYLKKLDRIKTDFVHTVSHDLRSPLTAILGYAELIERAGPVTDMQRDFIHRIQGSVRNITSLVDDLLDLGRIESGFDVRNESVRLEQIIRYAAEGLKKTLAEKRMLLQIDLPEEFPAVIANPVQMRQMVEHLLDNAVKYSHAGGVINVSGRTEQNQIILQFSDSGIGIPALDLPYIFDRFYRAANACGDIAGTGLGLSIVKSIIENHEGRIWVESASGKGTCFTIVLPFARGG